MAKENEFIEKYGAKWPARATELQIEMACIQQGGFWEKSGRKCGAGLSHHFERMRNILWPNLDSHRWEILCRDAVLQHKITVLMGPGSSGKTHSAAWIYLCDYFCFPNDTLVMVSTTDARGLELRVWGEIKKLHSEALDKFPYLPGNLIDSKYTITTDNLEEDRARDLRKGIIGIPCVQNGKFVGLGKYFGIKQKRVRLIADEAQFMGASFLKAFSNLNKNDDFRAIILGNPVDPLDPLGKAAEPLTGWSSQMEPDKTTTWKTRFMDGICVNLIGTDSPNFDYPQDQPPRFPYLIHKGNIAETVAFFGKDSLEYNSQCVGAMKSGLLSKRVVTRELCTQFRAMDDVVWKGTPLTRIYAVDAAYGGDRCVGGYVEFGEDINGNQILNIHKPEIIPVKVGTGVEPVDQIASYVRQACEGIGIPPENMFHDATGRGSLGTALARIWSAQTNPIDFGGAATNRPVSTDIFIYDQKLKQRRLLLCADHYKNFVTELWWSIRYAIEASQIRNLPEDVMEELCMRMWEKKTGKYQVEPKSGTNEKPGMKERTGRSPDLADWLAIAVEGARRRGFSISKLAQQEEENRNLDWLNTLRRNVSSLHRSTQLNHGV